MAPLFDCSVELSARIVEEPSNAASENKRQTITLNKYYSGAPRLGTKCNQWSKYTHTHINISNSILHTRSRFEIANNELVLQFGALSMGCLTNACYYHRLKSFISG